MKDMSFLNHPAMQDLDIRKKTIIIDLINSTEGKGLEQCMPALMKASALIKSQNLSFTNAETDLIMDILTKDLSPAEKAKLDMARKMMMTYKK